MLKTLFYLNFLDTQSTVSHASNTWFHIQTKYLLFLQNRYKLFTERKAADFLNRLKMKKVKGNKKCYSFS